MVDLNEFEDDEVITDSQIKVISNLVSFQCDCEAEVAIAEAELKKSKAKLRKVSENDLPDAMVSAGVTLFRTEAGLEVNLKESLQAAISKKNKPAAIKWLIEHDLESLVKENVVVPFDKGEGEKVKALIQLLESNGVSDFSVAPTVNTASVKAALKELIEEGVSVPEETFGLYFFKQAIVKKSS